MTSKKKNKKYYKPKYDITGLSDEEVYLLVRNRTLLTFPKNFLCKDSCKRIFRYVCLELYHFSREDVCCLHRNDFLAPNLIRDLPFYFENGFSELIFFSFPEWDIKNWELAKVPAHFWDDKENQKEFVEWIAKKENLDLTKQEDVSKIDTKLINHYGGSEARVAAGGTFNLISTVTGDRFQEWEVTKVSSWTEEKAIKAIKWLIEEKLKWSDEQVRASLRATTFINNNLFGLITSDRFGGSPTKALNFAYPGKFEK